MNQRLLIFLVLFIITGLPAQDIQPEITFDKQKLLILPSRNNEMEVKLTRIVATEATNLGRYEIIDRTQLEAILDEQALQMTGVVNDSDVVEFGRIAGAQEGMVINLISFNQRGVPGGDEDDNDDTNFFDLIIALATLTTYNTDKEEKYPDNIQTVITFSITKMDIETGKSIDAFFIDVEHTGGNRGKSLKRALVEARSRVSMKLRGMFTLTSQVLEVQGNEVTLLLGSEIGVKKGTLFEISSLDKKREFRGREVAVPGRSVALVRVTSLSNDANRGLVLRKWGRIKPGFKAVEKIYSAPAGLLQFNYGKDRGDFALRFKGIFLPFNKINFQGGLQMGTIKDSRGDNDLFIGLPLGMCYNLIQTPSFSLGGSFSLPLNLAFRRDDDSNLVLAVFVDPRIGLESTIMTAPRRDWIFSVDYVFANQTGKWTYTETKNDKPVTRNAVWDNARGGSPIIQPSGLYFSAGIRFLYF